MDFWTVILFGLATAGNLAVLKWKVEHERFIDAGIDAAVLATLAWLFSGTITGLATATIASAFISIYLLISPPDKLVEMFDEDAQKKKRKKAKKKKKFNKYKNTTT